MATTPPTLGADAFYGNADGRKIYVPASSVGTTSTDGTYKHDWSAYASAIEALPVTATGACGTNCTYTLYENGQLVISGTGAMADYATYGENLPWADNRSDIKTIVINNGVTSIGNWAFDNCQYVTSVSIPASVTSIGYYSFNYCSMTSLTFAENSSLKTIGSFAFNCAGLPSVTFPASVTSIGNNAFDGCVTAITFNSNPSIGADAFGSTTVTMNLTANSAGGTNWMTFYNKNYSFEADASTQVFKVTLSGDQLTMHEVEDKIVDKSTAVVLKTTGGGNPVMTLTTTSSGNTDTNSLKGVDDPNGLVTDGTFFVLNEGSQGVGFYKLTSGKTLGVGKAYLIYDDSPGTGGGDAREFFGFGDTTGINDVRGQKEDVRGKYYDLQGRRVSQPTKGLYIVNGKKVVIK